MLDMSAFGGFGGADAAADAGDWDDPPAEAAGADAGTTAATAAAAAAQPSAVAASALETGMIRHVCIWLCQCGGGSEEEKEQQLLQQQQQPEHSSGGAATSVAEIPLPCDLSQVRQLNPHLLAETLVPFPRAPARQEAASCSSSSAAAAAAAAAAAKAHKQLLQAGPRYQSFISCWTCQKFEVMKALLPTVAAATAAAVHHGRHTVSGCWVLRGGSR